MRNLLIAVLVSALLSALPAHAGELLQLGKYVMNDGKMKVSFEVKQIAGNRYFIEGGGTSGSGAMCMMNGVGELKGNQFAFGYNCYLTLTAAGGKLEIRDDKLCTACDPGAYISGSYEKQ